MTTVTPATPTKLKPLTPPLKWAGGKRWLLPAFTPLWQPHKQRKFIEPFSGGLAIPLGIQPESAILNDINPHVINFYRWLQDGLISSIEMENDSELYYQHRDRFNNLIRQGEDDSAEAAALFYYMNRTGFNGLCRFNKKGFYNVPMGRHKRINYKQDFSAYQQTFANWEFLAVDFEELPVAPEDFIYADPPYDQVFTAYSATAFTWGDQLRLADWLASHPGPVVATNLATDRILNLYESLSFDIEIAAAPRRISCNGNRARAKEIIATRNL